MRHYKIHTAETPFRCEFCPKRFNRSDKLNSHHKVHTGLKCHAKSLVKPQNIERSDTCTAALKVPDTAATTERDADEDEVVPSSLRTVTDSKGMKPSELKETPNLSATAFSVNIVLRCTNMSLVFYGIKSPACTKVSCLKRSSKTPVPSKQSTTQTKRGLQMHRTLKKHLNCLQQGIHVNIVPRFANPRLDLRTIESLTLLTNVSSVLRSSVILIPFNIMFQSTTQTK